MKMDSEITAMNEKSGGAPSVSISARNKMVKTKDSKGRF